MYSFLKITVLNYFKSEKHLDSQSGLFAYNKNTIQILRVNTQHFHGPGNYTIIYL